MRNKNSFKFMNIPDSDILCNLNITVPNNLIGNKAIFWNKYQMYILDLEDSENVAKEVFFSFDTLTKVLASHNYLICRDESGIVWKTIMNYTNLSESVFEVKPHFDKFEENIINLDQSKNGELLISLKVVSNICNLSVYDFSNFSLLNCYKIVNNDIVFNKTNYEKCKMYYHSIDEKEKLVIITFNGFTLYYFFLNIFEIHNCIVAEHLINCPTEITDIHCTTQYILISLSIGTIIKIDLDTIKHTKSEPQTIHLNTAILKILNVNDNIIYTDGQTMWRADNIFSIEGIHFRQIFVTLVKDFVYFDKQNEILCTTYMKKLYRFSLDDETAYIKTVSTKEYCTAQQLLDDMSYMHSIVSEMAVNDEIMKKIKTEESLITTIALANRQDIVKDMIHFEMTVHENYDDIVQNYKLLTLTNDIKDYYILDSYHLLIKLTVTTVHPKFTEILSDLFGKLEIHITIFSENKVFKTVTVKVIKQLKSMNIVVPLTYLKSTKITVCAELVTNIPGALDQRQTLWVSLHTNETVLSSEHFIKTILPSNNICHLKKTPETINNLICVNASKQYGNLFKFSKIKNSGINSPTWQLYVKLPNQYRELFGNEFFYKNLNSSQKKLLMSGMTSENLLKSGNSISLNVANEKVEIDIDIGFSYPVLKTSCVNLRVASDIRDFISNLLHSEQYLCEEFVSNSILKTLEDLEKNINLFAMDSVENTIELQEKFQKNVIISLNL